MANSNVAVVGAQWGDEGKGKVVDIYGKHADVIIRFQGGNNAGHTLVVDGKKVVLHLVPAASLHENKSCLIANGTVVDIEIFLSEIETLKQKGYLKTSKVFLSDRAHVIMPYHKILDQMREKKRGATNIGTTGRGIGPAYSDKTSRLGIRVGDLLSHKHLEARIEESLLEKNVLFKELYGADTFSASKLADQYAELGEKIKSYIIDANELVSDALEAKKKILFEGAQGALLDIDQGTYPFVTSSNTTSGGACTGAGIPPNIVDEVIAITKAYTTRVGSGPFPTELNDSVGERLQQVGNEFGATTGRKRRCGWLDLVALRHSKNMNGFTGLALMKLDVLSGLDEIKVCTAYEYKGKKFQTIPAEISTLEQLTPVYKTLKSWSESVTDLTNEKAVPSAMRDYISFIEDSLGVKTALLSVGPDRAQTVEIRNPFEKN
ncbi:MAG: adenylosuccinate synthase [Oligoflexia bacterium]|nr:adenylosuccinate synthase [Oligoflexia bacterium]